MKPAVKMNLVFGDIPEEEKKRISAELREALKKATPGGFLVIPYGGKIEEIGTEEEQQ